MKTITVSQLNSYLKNIVDAEEILHDIAVCGEVVNFKGVNSGNIFFSLKDENAEIACSGFGNGQRFLNIVKNGEKVVVVGTVSFWVKAGKINVAVKYVESFGKGELELKMLLLKEKLKALGYFDERHKKDLPKKITRVGIVTSETGAVIQDMCKIISRRNPFVKIILYPCVVQGERAAATIIEGVKFLDGYSVDVIIVARGGGSSEDLMCFNDESLAENVFKLKTPIISAVGHETDFTICDLVADRRAATPSEAAEIVAKDVLAEFAYLKVKFNQVANAQVKKIDGYEKDVKYFSSVFKNRLNTFFDKRENALLVYKERIEKFDPIAILKRGYSRVLKGKDTILFENISIGDELNIVMVGGTVGVKVLQKD